VKEIAKIVAGGMQIVKEIAKIVAGGMQIVGANVAEFRRNREHITKVGGMVRLAAMQSISQRGYDEWANGKMQSSS
jgi:hypothetical protein